MGRVAASVLVTGSPGEAEALWYDTSRWPSFVDGFAAVAKRDPQWPGEGGRLLWDSTPHGRGRVSERVVAHVPGGGQTVEFEDERLAGTQRIGFAVEGERTRVTLVLEYRIKDRNLLTPIVDVLFVRRAIGDAVRRTVTRFAHERTGDAELS